MTPTSAPDLPDIDKVLQMTKDMELISDFLTNGRFVGDRVYVSIEHLAECIRNTRPQSEASALATPVPVGWRPIETAPEGKDILVYCRETGECFVVFWALQMETKQGDWVIARANDGTCFICKNEAIPSNYAADCLHRFHCKCLDEYMGKTMEAKCPKCEAKIGHNAIMRLGISINTEASINLDPSRY